MATPFLTSALDGGEWLAPLSGRLNPVEISFDAHWIRGWVVWMLQNREQSLAPAENRTGTVQPVARPYAYRAFPDPYLCVLS
jgi:hypothetical protein